MDNDPSFFFLHTHIYILLIILFYLIKIALVITYILLKVHVFLGFGVHETSTLLTDTSNTRHGQQNLFRKYRIFDDLISYIRFQEPSADLGFLKGVEVKNYSHTRPISTAITRNDFRLIFLKININTTFVRSK